MTFHMFSLQKPKKRKSSTSEDSSDEGPCKKKVIELASDKFQETNEEKLTSSTPGAEKKETTGSARSEKVQILTDDELKALRAAIIARKKLSMVKNDFNILLQCIKRRSPLIYLTSLV